MNATTAAGPAPGVLDRATTVVGALELHAARRPQYPAYIDHQETLSYGALLKSARRGAAWLAAQGVRPGDTVALPLDPAAASARRALELVYAIAYAGAVTLPLFPEAPLAARIELIGRFGAHWLIASGAPQVAAARAIDPRGFDPADAGLDAITTPRADHADLPFAYLFTSGTTGAAKVLLPTHAQYYGSTSQLRWLSAWTPRTDRSRRFPGRRTLQCAMYSAPMRSALVLSARPSARRAPSCAA